MRPKFGVVSWDLDPHPIWEEVVERSLDLAAELDVVICPEIHSPTPIKHPVTQGYVDFIEKTGTEHFKLLIDTGIFQTAAVREAAEVLGTDDDEDVPPPLRPLRVPMADLVEVLPHTHFIQAKFFEIDDDLHDLHVPWGDIVPTLEKAGWNGWLSSEYEGRREPYRGRDQVRRQHALLRSLQSGRSRGDPSRRRRPLPAAGRPHLDARGLRHPGRAGADPRLRVVGARARRRRSWRSGTTSRPGRTARCRCASTSRPAGERTARPCLVWAHGGGFLGGDLDMREADWTAREVCVRAGAVVVSVDYRLAVDGVCYPVPHDDTVAAIAWVRDNADGARASTPTASSVGGASAGANLTAGAVLKLRDRDGWLPSHARLRLRGRPPGRCRRRRRRWPRRSPSCRRCSRRRRASGTTS